MILEMLGSSAAGSAIGGFFAWLNRKADIAAQIVDNTHEKDRWTHDLAVKDKDLEYARIEATGRKDVAIAEADGAIGSAQFQAIGQAHEADAIDAATLKAAGKWKWLLIVADAFRRFIRPVATVALTGAALWLSMLLIGMLRNDGWASLDAAQKIDLGKMALDWVFCQAAGTLTYWFMTRPTSSK